MKKSTLYESVATVAALLGALLLVGVYFPVLNPGFWRNISNQEGAPVSRYILGTLASLLIFSGAWYFNCKARTLKREEKERETKHEQNPPA